MSALDGQTSGDDELTDDELDDKKLLARIKQEIKFYETKAAPWERKSKKIIRRYKDERNNGAESTSSRYNILWSNTQLLLPALYAKKPVANIERRNRIKDDLGRVTSSVLERCISYYIDDKLDAAVREAVLDLCLPGRGVVWARYEPKFSASEEGEEVTEDAETEEYLEDENVCWDWVAHNDFGHSWARVWDEVEMCWRRVPMSRKEIKVRFPDIDVDDIKFDYAPTDLKDTKVDTVSKKAMIYEVWDKTNNMVYWLQTDYKEGFLDKQEDPLKLKDFFPTPRPLFATLGNDSCIPVPMYVSYQDQAIELDQLTGRIASIVKSVKVAGVYDASAQGVARLLSEGVENQLLPIDQMAMLTEKGGLEGVMLLMPMKEILETLQGLYDSRDKVKQDIFELTGISDILRGASDPQETYGAQRIKSAFGTLRLSALQDEVQRFCRDLIDIGTQIIANHFSQETIQRISNMTLLTGEQKQLVQMNNQYKQQMQQFQQMQQKPPAPQQPGMPPQMPPQPPMPPPPVPPEVARLDPDDIEELMTEPTWEEIMQFMQDEPLMNYRVDIETDSTIKIDQQAEQQARVQFLETAGGFMQKAAQVTDPLLAPLMAKMMEFGLRSFKIGRDLEGEFEMTIKKLEKEAQNPKPKPNPEMEKVQGQMQLQQQKQQDDKELKIMQMQLDQKKAQADSQAELERLKAQASVDTNQSNLDSQLAQQKANQDDARELAIAKMNNETKIICAQIQAKAQLDSTALSQSSEDSPVSTDGNGGITKGPSTGDLIATVVDQLEKSFNGIAQGHAMLADALTKPKQVVRDPQGNITGVQ